MRHFWIRTDASKNIGTGHVVRCLTVAQYLVTQGERVTFICRLFDGNLISMIQAQGFKVISLPASLEEISEQHLTLFEGKALPHQAWLEASQQQDACATLSALQGSVSPNDWLLVDHFALDHRWEVYVGGQLNCHLAAIDGQADRRHAVDVLVDPTMCQSENKWSGLLQPDTCLYQGIAYSPIRSEFFDVRQEAKVRSQLSKILIAFGGVDLPNYTLATLQVLLSLPISSLSIDVVVGMNYPHWDALETVCKGKPNVTLYQQTSNMHGLMRDADLSIGAGGTMAWERCMLYLPTLAAMIAENQRQQVMCLEQNGVAWSMGDNLESFIYRLRHAMKLFMEWPEILENMSLSAKHLTKGIDRNAWNRVFKENDVDG